MNKLLEKWDLLRIIRLILGITVAAYAIHTKVYGFLILGGLFLLQAIMNISCCGSGGCCTINDNPKKNIYGDQIKKYKAD